MMPVYKKRENFVPIADRAVFLYGFNKKHKEWEAYREQCYQDLRKHYGVYIVKFDIGKNSDSAYVHLRNKDQADKLKGIGNYSDPKTGEKMSRLRLGGSNIVVYPYIADRNPKLGAIPRKEIEYEIECKKLFRQQLDNLKINTNQNNQPQHIITTPEINQHISWNKSFIASQEQQQQQNVNAYEPMTLEQYSYINIKTPKITKQSSQKRKKCYSESTHPLKKIDSIEFPDLKTANSKNINIKKQDTTVTVQPSNDNLDIGNLNDVADCDIEFQDSYDKVFINQDSPQQIIESSTPINIRSKNSSGKSKLNDFTNYKEFIPKNKSNHSLNYIPQGQMLQSKYSPYKDATIPNSLSISQITQHINTTSNLDRQRVESTCDSVMSNSGYNDNILLSKQQMIYNDSQCSSEVGNGLQQEELINNVINRNEDNDLKRRLDDLKNNYNNQVKKIILEEEFKKDLQLNLPKIVYNLPNCDVIINELRRVYMVNKNDFYKTVNIYSKNITSELNRMTSVNAIYIEAALNISKNINENLIPASIPNFQNNIYQPNLQNIIEHNNYINNLKQQHQKVYENQLSQYQNMHLPHINQQNFQHDKNPSFTSLPHSDINSDNSLYNNIQTINANNTSPVINLETTSDNIVINNLLTAGKVQALNFMNNTCQAMSRQSSLNVRKSEETVVGNA